MRKITRVILHCSATKPGQNVNAEIIRHWHTAPKPKGRGWRDIGYHFVILEDGTIQRGRPLGVSGAHTKGHNYDSVGVCYTGGLDENGSPKDTMTDAQEKSFRALFASLNIVLGEMTLHGHNEFAAKACPCFKVSEKFKDLCDE